MLNAFFVFTLILACFLTVFMIGLATITLRMILIDNAHARRKILRVLLYMLAAIVASFSMDMISNYLLNKDGIILGGTLSLFVVIPLASCGIKLSDRVRRLCLSNRVLLLMSMITVFIASITAYIFFITG